MKRLFIICIFLFPLLLSGQINKNGVPFTTNYSPHTYKASEQNWAVVQDNRGVMYFGNNDDGVLEYDGKNWRKIPVPNRKIVRSLAIDSLGTIYIGAVGEFGYLAPNNNGELKYNSLLVKLDSAEKNFGDVWKTRVHNDKVYFCSVSKIIEYNIKNKSIKIHKLGENFLFTFLINDDLYTGNYLNGLMKIDNDSLVLASNGSYFHRKNIFTILEHDDNNVIIGTGANGVYKYNSLNGNISSDILSKTTNKYLKKSYINTGTNLPDNNLAFGTYNSGSYIIDNSGKIKYWINTDYGLLDKNVYDIYYNKRKNKFSEPLWLALNKGIAKIEARSPIASFGKEFGLSGSINDIIRYRGTLYVATSSGVFYLEYENELPVFKHIKDINILCWSFNIFNIKGPGISKLLVGTNNGVFEIINKNTVKSVEDQIINIGREEDFGFNVYKLYSQKNINKLYLGTYDFGLIIFDYKNGKWSIDYEIKDIDEIRSIEKDKYNNIWFTTSFNGIYRVNITDNDTITKQYSTEHGLPEMATNFICFIEGDLRFITLEGLYCFDNKNEIFYPDSTFPNSYIDGSKSIFRFYEGQNNNYWFSLNNEKTSKKWIEKVIKTKDNKYQVDSIPFLRIPNLNTDAIYSDPDGIVWFGISDRLYSYDQTVMKDYNTPYYTLIRKAIIGEDSVIFSGTNYSKNDKNELQIAIEQPDELKVELDYRNNGVSFQYAAPFFEEENFTEYSCYLQGFKDTWSKWSVKTERVYTNLDEGHYTFMVKAKNIYGAESEIAKFSFSILPPWYRTIIAYIAYVILSIVSVIFIVKFYTRRLELEKIRLEGIVKERTAEVVKQKDEIEEQKKSITDSIQYASRIQKAVVPSEVRANEILPEHFILWRPRDIVSGDYWWMTKKDNKIIIVAADCTGHGVPGAFMSMLGVSFLNEIVNKSTVTTACVILNDLRAHVKDTLKQTGKEGEAKDGMDVALLILDIENNKVQYSGAYNPLYLFRNGELIETKADKNPIGIFIKEKDSFTNHEIDVIKGDTFYIFSDGFVDQFGGEKGGKYKTKNFKILLSEIQDKPMKEQGEILDKTVDDWRGDIEQIDDIIIVGIRM
ncbi:MAG: SpoIIE family protein phosphatase [Bacteroidales bacterium]|nr:SpoIIE family protein phosphatase [Bacteroidales bacterium]